MIQQAILALRARTGNNTYGTQMGNGGRLQMVEVIFEKRKTIVNPLSDWLYEDEYVAFVNAYLVEA